MKAQANLRVLVALPVIAIGCVILLLYRDIPARLEWVVGSYVLYTCATLGLAASSPERLHSAITYATAVVDPLFVTLGMWLMSEAAPMLAGFYLFSIIGYGARSGKGYMFVSQMAALVGFCIIYFLDDYWRASPLTWAGLAIPIVVVPIYLAPLMERLQMALSRAESQSRAKSDLLARVSHELRTPLAGIVSAAELVRVGTSIHGARLLADTMLGLSQHLLTEINDLLDEAKYEANALVLAPAPCDLSTIGGTLRAALLSQAEKKGLSFEVLIDPRVQQPVIADSHYLGRVIMNLAGNAVKFTQRGKVTVRIALLEASMSSYFLRFSVEDTGLGIPREDQERVFEPFVQLSQSRHQVCGTGLGLTLSKDLVNLMGGALQLSSEPGVGSRFWFDLRLGNAAMARGANVVENVSSVQPRRILLVDDNLTNLHLLREVLMLDGHKVTTADSGKAALALLQNGEEWDVVFLDYNLPDMTGGTLLQTYRFGTTRPVPVYFLTADASPMTRSALDKSGAMGVLSKPIRIEEIRAAITSATPDSASPMRPSEVPALRAVPVIYVDMTVIDRLAGISKRPTFLAEMMERALADIDRNVRDVTAALLAG
ncbi:MAG TPA: ATP-binding protein, partial [Rhodocyclaceae bacterium]|nr:ATP-binding protein [Rhodocyclaceae bacterium]